MTFTSDTRGDIAVPDRRPPAPPGEAPPPTPMLVRVTEATARLLPAGLVAYWFFAGLVNWPLLVVAGLASLVWMVVMPLLEPSDGGDGDT